MKKYTEQDLLKAIEYACSYQKGHDYQTVGRYLLKDDQVPDSHISLMDELAYDKTAFSEIELKDIFD